MRRAYQQAGMPTGARGMHTHASQKRGRRRYFGRTVDGWRMHECPTLPAVEHWNQTGLLAPDRLRPSSLKSARKGKRRGGWFRDTVDPARRDKRPGRLGFVSGTMVTNRMAQTAQGKAHTTFGSCIGVSQKRSSCRARGVWHLRQWSGRIPTSKGAEERSTPTL